MYILPLKKMFDPKIVFNGLNILVGERIVFFLNLEDNVKKKMA